MKFTAMATALIGASEAIELEKQHHGGPHEYEQRLSQSFASAFHMLPPKLMNAKGVAEAQGTFLTHEGTGGAFLDGYYMNTTRKSERDERTGEEAQYYKYMWKKACAFTKWVPSNQFMYANLDYNPETMTLERFGFIGMDKKCYWGSIGVLWKRPLPVDQILPNIQQPKGTNTEAGTNTEG